MMVVRSVILKAGVFCGIIAVFLCFAYRGSGKDGRPLKMAREIIQNVYGLHIPNEMRASLNNLVNDRQGSFVCVLKNLIL